MNSIHQRLPLIDERVIRGRREGNLITDVRDPSAVGTTVERMMLLVTLAKMDTTGRAAAGNGVGTLLNRSNALPPKESDIAPATKNALENITWRFNIRPPDNLGYKCPPQLSTPSIFHCSKLIHHHQLVALQTEIHPCFGRKFVCCRWLTPLSVGKKTLRRPSQTHCDQYQGSCRGDKF